MDRHRPFFLGPSPSHKRGFEGVPPAFDLPNIAQLMPADGDIAPIGRPIPNMVPHVKTPDGRILRQGLSLLLLGFGPLLTQPEQWCSDFVAGQLARPPVIAPAVDSGHGLIQRPVGVFQPCRAGVVELVNLQSCLDCVI